MSDLDEASQRIMERARQRRQQINNENDMPTVEETKSPTKAHSTPVKSSRDPTPPPLPSAPSPSLVVDEDEARRTYRKSRFSALAKEVDEWEYDAPSRSKSKDAFVKGSSPRLSIGETRASVLFTPGGGRSPLKEVSPVKATKSPTTKQAEDEQRRIRFAYPIARTTMADESSNDSPVNHENETSSTVGVFSPKEVTSFADDGKKMEEEEEYGPQTFLKKDARGKNTSTSSVRSSPKPFSPSVVTASHSPVRFTPTSSSPIMAEARMSIACTIPLDISSISPATRGPPSSSATAASHHFSSRRGGHGMVLDSLERTAKEAMYTSSPSQITPSNAKHFFAQLPTKSPVRNLDGASPESSPIRSAAISSQRATTIRKELEEKLKSGEASMPRPTPSSLPQMRNVSRIAPPQGAVTPSLPSGVRTQWRGSSNTPVIAGADPSEKTRPDVRAANLASLRTRWEFSAATGTPLHPDKSERELLDEAKKEQEKATYQKTHSNVTTPRKKGRDDVNTSRKSLTSSPVGKSPRLHLERPEEMDEYEDDDEGPIESGEEEEMLEADERETDRIIDKAFSFMEGNRSPFKSVGALEKVLEEEDEHDMEMEREMEREAKEMEAEEERRERRRREQEEEEEEERMRREKERREAERAAAADAAAKEEREREKPTFKAPPPPETSMVEERDEEEEEEESTATGKPGLVHTISFYRKRRAEKTTNQGHETMDFRVSTVPPADQGKVIGGSERRPEEDEEELRAEENRLQKALAVQQEQVTQARRALEFCSRTQFSGSREEVETNRALLIATETKRQLMHALEDLRGGLRLVDGPRGAMRIGPISVQLVRDSMAHNDTVYYFIVLLRHGSQLTHTSLVAYDPAMRSMGKPAEVEFAQYLHLEKLPPDFNCMVEVWALCARREQLAHEEKFKIKGGGGTMKKKETKFPNLLPGSSSSSSQQQQQYTQMDGRRGSDTPTFKMMGRTRLTIDSAERRRFTLEDTCHPLEGTIALKIKRYAMEKGDVLHRGFLSLYQRTPAGLGSWTRYWCVVENGEMRFWRCPEDETVKDWLVLIDLSTCASDGVCQEAAQDLCPFPNSFHVDVWVPKDGATSAKQLEKLRVLMAADRKEDLALWLDILNKTIRNLLMWAGSRTIDNRV